MIVWINGIWLISVARVVWLVHRSRPTVAKFCEWQCTVMVVNESELSGSILTVCEGSNTVYDMSMLRFC